MLNVESKGGDPTLGVEMLLEDRELWTNRVVLLQQDKQLIKKNVIMAEKMNIKLLGVVENMCYIKCNNCMEHIKVFSKKTGAEQAKVLGIPLLMELPIDLDLVESMEEGKAESYIVNSKDYELLLENFKNNLKL